MPKSKMTPEEYSKASKRSAKAIQRGSEAGLRAVARMSKHPLSYEQAKAQFQRNNGLATAKTHLRMNEK